MGTIRNSVPVPVRLQSELFLRTFGAPRLCLNKGLQSDRVFKETPLKLSDAVKMRENSLFGVFLNATPVEEDAGKSADPCLIPLH